MTDHGQRQPTSDQAPHAIPVNPAVLAAPRQRTMPKPADLESKNRQRRLIHGHSVVANVPTHHRLQPLALMKVDVRQKRRGTSTLRRPRATTTLGKPGISRLPSEVSPYVHGVSDRAGLGHTSRYRCTRWGLPLSPTASASRSKCLTRLNTRPARPPVNASSPPLRAASHDSGPM